MKKKFLIIILVFCSIINIFVNTYISNRIFRSNLSRFTEFINWDVYLPYFKEEQIIYQDFFMDGQMFGTITFYNSISMDIIISVNNLNKIDSDSINIVNEMFDKYYRYSPQSTKDALDNVDFNEFVVDGNYYLYREDENGSFYIMVLSKEDKKIYYFYNCL